MCQLLAIIKDYFSTPTPPDRTQTEIAKPKLLVDISPSSDFALDLEKLNIVLKRLIKRKIDGVFYVYWTHDEKPCLSEELNELNLIFTKELENYDHVFKSGREKID